MREAVTFPYSHKHGDVLTVSTGYGSSSPLTHLLEYGNSKGGILPPAKIHPSGLRRRGFVFIFCSAYYGEVVTTAGVVDEGTAVPPVVLDAEPAPTMHIFGNGR